MNSTDKLAYDGLIDGHLGRREFLPLADITVPQEQALALAQDALYRFLDVLPHGDVAEEADRAERLSVAVQLVLVAARLPLEATITMSAMHVAGRRGVWRWSDVMRAIREMGRRGDDMKHAKD